MCVIQYTNNIFDTRVGDSGNYTCLATNAFGNDSKQASLVVNGNDSEIMFNLLPFLVVANYCPYYVNNS